MKHRWLGIVGTVLFVGTVRPTHLVAQTERGPYARIAILRPHDGDTVDFEAGYIRHLEWHRQAKDTWAWYGWTIWAGQRAPWRRVWWGSAARPPVRGRRGLHRLPPAPATRPHNAYTRFNASSNCAASFGPVAPSSVGNASIVDAFVHPRRAPAKMRRRNKSPRSEAI